MPFKDEKDGQTHSFNDGCGEPAHNVIESSEQRAVREYQERLQKKIRHYCENAEGLYQDLVRIIYS